MNTRIISADSHIVEPGHLWQDYMEPEWREKAPKLIHASTYDLFVWEGGKTGGYGRMAGAGHARDKLAGGLGRFADFVPDGAWQPAQRLKDMDLDGVDAETLYPTTGLWIARSTSGAYQRAVFRAYNRWLADYCSAASDRLYGIAMISLEDIDLGIEDLREARKLGLVGGMISVYPGDDKQYDLPMYDPFWAAAQELQMPLSLHISTERREGMLPRESIAGTMVIPLPIQLTIGDMVISGVFDRFPDLHIVSVENDAGWAAAFALRMDFRYKMDGTLTHYPCRERPSEYMKRNVHFAFVDDLSAVPMRTILGPGNLMWSSDYPHFDSTWPESQRVIAEHFEGVSDEDRRLITGGNAERLYVR